MHPKKKQNKAPVLELSLYPSTSLILPRLPFATITSTTHLTLGGRLNAQKMRGDASYRSISCLFYLNLTTIVQLARDYRLDGHVDVPSGLPCIFLTRRYAPFLLLTLLIDVYSGLSHFGLPLHITDTGSGRVLPLKESRTIACALLMAEEEKAIRSHTYQPAFVLLLPHAQTYTHASKYIYMHPYTHT